MGMECFQRNWFIVSDAKYLFDQTRLQLKKPKSLDFKSHQPGLEGAGSGEGEARGVPGQKPVAKMSLQDTLCMSPGETALGRVGLLPLQGQAQVLPVFQMFFLKGSPNATGSVPLRDTLYCDLARHI